MSVRQGNDIISGTSSNKYLPDLFDWKWSDHLLDNPSWLRADTFSWQRGDIYIPSYNQLVAEYGDGTNIYSETIEGITISYVLADNKHKIVVASDADKVEQIYQSTGVAWYYILDTVNQRFKLPRAKHNKYEETLGVVGNGITLGLTDGTNNAGINSFANSTGLDSWTGLYGTSVGTAQSGSRVNVDKSMGITTDPTKSGIIAQQNEDTNQYKYLYFYVGPYSSKDTGNIDVLKTKQDVDTAVNYNHITNCITNIPQDIKLELNNGTLTLKAGSKVYVPNGAGNFDEITITSDTNISMGSGSYTKLIFVKSDGTIATRTTPTTCYSGSSAPTGQTNMAWYDTTNNLVKLTSDSGSTWTGGYSLPIAIATITSDVITSIDQVFNGFGYIGSTVFALPGVKGLIPDGRNIDGTLKNKEFVINGWSGNNIVNITTSGWNSRWTLYIGNNENDRIIHPTELEYVSDTPPSTIWTATALWFSPSKNKWFFTGDYGANWNPIDVINLIRLHETNTKIDSLEEDYYTFRALDYNDREYIATQAMPSKQVVTITVGAAGTAYRAPDDGWFNFRGRATAANQYAYIGDPDYCRCAYQRACIGNGDWIVSTIPAKKDDQIIINWTLGGEKSLYFIYASGAQ